MQQEILNKIRLRDYELLAIQQAFKECFLPNDHIWLFGSRAKLDKKGGDIDLYVETNAGDLSDGKKREQDFVLKLWNILGEQRIDVVLNILASKKDATIYTIARETGVQLL